MDKQKPFLIDKTLVTSEMLGRYILGELETTQAWVVPIYKDEVQLDKVDRQDSPDRCPDCKGKGEIHWTQIDEPICEDGMAFRLGVGVWECEKDCLTCKGTGKAQKASSDREKIRAVLLSPFDEPLTWCGLCMIGCGYLFEEKMWENCEFRADCQDPLIDQIIREGYEWAKR